MSPPIIQSIHIDHENPFVITQELLTYCRSKSLHVIFGATNLDLEEADAYVLSSSGHQIIPVSIRKRRKNQVAIYSTDEIPKIIKSISRAFQNQFLYT